MEVAAPVQVTEAARAIREFDVARLEHQSWFLRIRDRLFLYPYLQIALGLLRWITPVLRIPIWRIALVLRYDEVCDVLSKSRQFPVPWGWKMKLVTSNDPLSAPDNGGGGRNFVLGMKEPDTVYRQDYALLTQTFPYDDAKRTVTAQARDVTAKILDEWATKSSGKSFEFDVVQELVLRVPTELCESYYGIEIPDKRYFANCMLAVSSFVFAPSFDAPKPGQKIPKGMRMALDAAAPIRSHIRSAMQRSRPSGCPAATGPRNPLERLMACPAHVGTVDDDRIHAQLFGMVLGFTPTNVLAGGNLLETLLRHPAFMARAVDAALCGDDDRLWSCLREALRFRNINIGPLRRCSETTRVVGADGRATRIRKDYRVIVCSQSAMFDGRRIPHPWLFDNERPDENYLMFATGQHWCLGAYIAIEQLTQMFKVLLSRYEVRTVQGKTGRMRRFNVFPLHMTVSLHAR